jgi:hypothetical protein
MRELRAIHNYIVFPEQECQNRATCQIFINQLSLLARQKHALWNIETSF